MRHAGKIFAIAVGFWACAAFGQGWPNKPVRLILGSTGGVNDVVARVLADDLGKRLGQPFIVEARPGANQLIAARAVQSAAPDGYMIFSGAGTGFTSVFLKDNPMDPTKDLQPVSLIAFGDLLVMVRADLGVNSLQELAAKGRSVRLRHSSPAPGVHAVMALVAKRLGFDYDNIPYKTTDQVVASLLSGNGDMVLTSVAGFTPYIQSGKIRVLAALSPVRSPLMPGVATAKEQGVDIDMRFRLAFWASPGTPRDIVSKLVAAVSDASKTPNMNEKLSSVAMVPTSSTPEELVRAFESDMRVYREAAALIGLQPE